MRSFFRPGRGQVLRMARQAHACTLQSGRAMPAPAFDRNKKTLVSCCFHSRATCTMHSTTRPSLARRLHGDGMHQGIAHREKNFQAAPCLRVAQADLRKTARAFRSRIGRGDDAPARKNQRLSPVPVRVRGWYCALRIRPASADPHPGNDSGRRCGRSG